MEVKNLDKVGIVRLDFTWQPRMTELHIFRTLTHSGALQETKGEALVALHNKVTV